MILINLRRECDSVLVHEVFIDRARWKFMFFNTLVNVPTCIANIAWRTQATFKFIVYVVLIDYCRFFFVRHHSRPVVLLVKTGLIFFFYFIVVRIFLGSPFCNLFCSYNNGPYLYFPGEWTSKSWIAAPLSVETPHHCYWKYNISYKCMLPIFLVLWINSKSFCFLFIK